MRMAGRAEGHAEPDFKRARRARQTQNLNELDNFKGKKCQKVDQKIKKS